MRSRAAGSSRRSRTSTSPGSAAPLDNALRDAIAWGNETIGFVGSNRPQMSGMSTTLTAVALANDGTYTFANIGDSRTYLLRDGELKQLSRDDSFVQHMIDEGI